MSKYIDAEKLIAEIERRLSELSDNCIGHRHAYKNILSFIASLQQEQPDNEDIDKVAQELYEHLYELKRRNNVPTNLYDKKEIIDLWKAGIEYGRNHPKKEQPEVDFEEEVESYLDGFIKTPTRTYFRNAIRHFYELGLNARKED